MGYLLGIVIASVALMFICIIFFPKIKIGKVSLSTFYFPPLVGAIILISTGLINYQTLWTSMTASNTINPIFILVLFFSMTLISIVLDEAGFFRYLAEKTAQSTSMNQKTLFLDFYILISVLTIFTSNDIIILTFTPFLMSFCKKAKIDPLPYIVSEFVAANTWSILLIIGNPTNIYLASSFNATFFSYLKVMYLPAIFAGLTSFLVMRVIFNKKLQAPLQTEETNQVEKPDLHLMLPSIIFLVVCVILLAVSSFIGFSMWLIALCSAVFLILYYLIYGFINLQSLDILVRALKRLPYELIPFVLSMFVLSYGLQAYGVAQSFASLFGSQDPVFRYGLTSFLACNVINNIPMSVFYTSVIQVADSSIQTQAMYASVIGSNIGAFLSPIGALAGIMWMSIIKDYNYDYSFGKFTLYGTIVSVPTIFASLSGLLITLL
jgi:arsenical pump membrane protein